MSEVPVYAINEYLTIIEGGLRSIRETLEATEASCTRLLARSDAPRAVKRRLGRPIGGSHLTDEQVTELLALARDGTHSLQQIGARFGITKSGVEYHISKAKKGAK